MPRKIIATPEKEKEAKKVFYALSHGKTYDDLAKENNKPKDYYFSLMKTYKPILGITDKIITKSTWLRYTGEIAEIARLYTEEKMTTRELGQYYQVSERTIAKCLTDYGVTLRPRGFQSRTDQTLFNNLDNELVCYVIGLITADGSISADNRSITITLTCSDGYLLEQINDLFLSGSGNISLCHKEDGDKARMYLTFHGKQLCEALNKYNIVPNKSYLLKELSPLIPRQYYHHYIRGLFDGDGICSKLEDKIRIGFCAHEKAFVENYQHFLIQQLDMNKTSLFNTGNCWQVSWASRKDITTFYNYIYKDATIFLRRKKEKIERYIYANPEVTN